MKRKSLFVVALFGQCFAVSLSAGQAVTQAGKLDAAALVRQAAVEANKALRSGQGEGLYEKWVKNEGAKDFEQSIKAATTIAFDQGKYFIKLQYELNKGRPERSRVIINDRKELVTSWFSPLIHPLGAVAEVFDAKQPEDKPSTVGFPFDPSEQRVVNIEKLLAFTSEIAWKPAAGGGFVGVTAPKARLTYKLFASPANGYNVDKFVIFVEGERDPCREWNVKWKKTGSVWVLERWEEVTRLPGSSTERHVFNYKSFSPNALVAQAMFNRESLGLPPGARILDRRPPPQGPPAAP